MFGHGLQPAGNSTRPPPRPPIPRPRMAEGYQPKFPPGVDIEKIKANPPRDGSGVQRKPQTLTDYEIGALAQDIIEICRNHPWKSPVNAVTDAIRQALRN